MMFANKKFEEMGYTITYAPGKIIYHKKADSGIYSSNIIFNLKEKDVALVIESPFTRVRQQEIHLKIDRIRGIDKKCEELGWYD